MTARECLIYLKVRRYAKMMPVRCGALQPVKCHAQLREGENKAMINHDGFSYSSGRRRGQQECGKGGAFRGRSVGFGELSRLGIRQTTFHMHLSRFIRLKAMKCKHSELADAKWKDDI